jgi:hypothetical protein
LTKPVATFSRSLRRQDVLRVAAAALGVACLVLLASYVVGVATSQPTPGGVVAAAALGVIAGSGILYAWRLGAGGLVD